MNLEKYIELSEEVFISEGVANFSMEWLAKKIGSTKRTLYNNFESRDELFSSIIDQRKEKIKNSTLPKFSEYGNDSFNIYKDWIIYNQNTMTEYGRIFIPSLQNKFPECYQYFIHVMQQHCREFLALLIPRGRDEGLIVKNFNMDSYSSFVFNVLIACLNQPAKETDYTEMSNFLIRSICTGHGLRRLGDLGA